MKRHGFILASTTVARPRRARTCDRAWPVAYGVRPGLGKNDARRGPLLSQPLIQPEELPPVQIFFVNVGKVPDRVIFVRLTFTTRPTQPLLMSELRGRLA
jgi:hypothetical protein